MIAVWKDFESIEYINTSQQFDRFLQVLKSDDRQPVVVVTLPDGGSEPWIDLRLLDSSLRGSALLFVLSPEATFWLTDSLGKTYSVFHGYVRVYGAFNSRGNVLPDLAQRFRSAPWNRTHTTQKVIDHVLQLQFQANPLTMFTSLGDEEICDAAVDSVGVSEVVVKTSNGNSAFIVVPEVWPGISGLHLFKRGQHLRGRYRRIGIIGSFSPEFLFEDVRVRAKQFIGEGRRILVKVVRVEPGQVFALIHPQLELAINVPDGEDASQFVSQDDVITVESIVVDDFIMAEFAEQETTDSLPVLPDGPPWLEQQTPEVVPSDAELLAFIDEPQNSEDPALVALRRENLEYQATVSRLTRQISDLRRSLRAAQRLSMPKLFSDEEEQFRYEVKHVYLEDVPPSMREEFPFDELYAIGRRFLESVNMHVAAGAINREKIIRVCAEVVCGRIREIPIRDDKPWPEGWTHRHIDRDRAIDARRVRLQVETPNARRLRYWQLTNGHVEFERVVGHDEDLD